MLEKVIFCDTKKFQLPCVSVTGFVTDNIMYKNAYPGSKISVMIKFNNAIHLLSEIWNNKKDSKQS